MGTERFLTPVGKGCDCQKLSNDSAGLPRGTRQARAEVPPAAAELTCPVPVGTGLLSHLL